MQMLLYWETQQAHAGVVFNVQVSTYTTVQKALDINILK